MSDYQPMLAVDSKDFGGSAESVGKVLESTGGFVFQIKYDGERALAYIKGGSVRLMSRRNIDISHRFPKITAALARLPDCVIDGEIVALDENGKVDFGKLQVIAHTDSREKIVQFSEDTKTAFVVFDILEKEGVYIGKFPQEVRNIQLQVFGFYEPLRLAQNYTKLDEAWNSPECVEGLIAKRLNAPYYQSRNSAWIKLKKWREKAVEFTDYEAHEQGGGITLTNIDGDRVSIGSVEIADKIRKMLNNPDIFCVKVEVQYLGLTEDGRMRFPSFKRLVEVE